MHTCQPIRIQYSDHGIMESVVPWRTFNIHGISPLSKKFFIENTFSSDYSNVLKGSFKNCSLKGSWGTKNGSSIVKSPFGPLCGQVSNLVWPRNPNNWLNRTSSIPAILRCKCPQCISLKQPLQMTRFSFVGSFETNYIMSSITLFSRFRTFKRCSPSNRKPLQMVRHLPGRGHCSQASVNPPNSSPMHRGECAFRARVLWCGGGVYVCVCLEQQSGEAWVFVELREDKRTRSCLSKGSVSWAAGRGEAPTQVHPVREWMGACACFNYYGS